MSIAQIRAGVLTISDSCSKGEKTDHSGSLIIEILRKKITEIIIHKIVPDEMDEISKVIMDWSDNDRVDFIITTGGTGLFPRDVTPEAIKPLLDREIPGISEAIRIRGLEQTPNSILSRGISGTRKYCLIITLPGSPKAVELAMDIIIPIIPHALQKIRGDSTPCHTQN